MFNTLHSHIYSQSSTWSMYKADASASSYSPLQQIDKSNVDSLKVAWIFDPDDGVDTPTWYGSQSNPIVIDTFMYVTSKRNRVYALNPSNGHKIWEYDPFNGGEVNSVGGQSRGVTYWEEGEDSRILFTASHYLYAVNAITGKPFDNFGEKGRVDLNVGMREDPDKIDVVATSPGIIYEDLIILGSRIATGKQDVPGYIRAFNVKTGELVWTFHTIPLPGEKGYDTWPEGAWKKAGGANNWGGMSLDEKRGLVYIPTASPTYDYYGANRIGKNLFGNSVLALKAGTGELIWYFQTVHHDLWGYDLTTAPNLVTIERKGKSIDAVAQITKFGLVFVLERETGEPLFPVEERPVPRSDVPGEESWPTQPFPVKPLPLSKISFEESDISNYSEEVRDSLTRVFRKLRYEGPYTPPSVKGTLTVPGSFGGVQWGGGAYDPESRILYVKSNNSAEIAKLEKVNEIETKNGIAELTPADEKKRIAEGSETEYINITASVPFVDKNGYPGIKPPWGVMNAINLNSGDYVWQKPVGNDPEYKRDGFANTGLATTAGAMVTKGGLLFIGATSDRKFRAFNKKDGELIWETQLPGVGGSIPSSYLIENKQYIVISVSPNEKYPAGCVIAFSL